jgi:hypothetical protein
MLDRPSYEDSKSPAPSTVTDESPADDDTATAEPDPLRQLFVRHSNHLDGNQARRLRSSLRLRLFG